MDVLSVIGKIIAMLGGGAVIILGLSTWIGKIWANIILEKEKSKYAREIEHYKSELDKNLNRLSAINEKELFISKLQYEKEFSIYLDLWERIHEIIHTAIRISDLVDDFSLPFNEQIRKDIRRNKKHLIKIIINIVPI